VRGVGATGIVEEWGRFQRYLIGEKHLGKVIDWVAYLLQVPGEKPAFGILLESDVYGIGKSLWGDIVCLLMGWDRLGNPQGVRRGMSEVYSRYFDSAASVIFIDEIQADRASQLRSWERLKRIIIEDEIKVESKSRVKGYSTSTSGVIYTANKGHNVVFYGDTRCLHRIKVKQQSIGEKFPILHRFRKESLFKSEWFKAAYVELVRYYEGVQIINIIDSLDHEISH
jgi:hypothetical protein